MQPLYAPEKGPSFGRAPRLIFVIRHFLIAGALIGFILLLSTFFPKYGALLASALHDAYVQVASFVALTFFLLYLGERAFNFNLSQTLLKHQSWHIPISAVFGSLPGCGGAVMIVTQFCRGYLSFGALVTALITTMGDAAFILIAQRPTIAVLVIVIQFAVGISFGYLVDRVFGKDFMRPKNAARQHEAAQPSVTVHEKRPRQEKETFSYLELCWIILIIPGLFLGLCNAFQFDLGLWLQPDLSVAPQVILWTGACAGILCFMMWFFAPTQKSLMNQKFGASSQKRSVRDSVRGIIIDTNFIFTWVAFSFLLFELIFAWSNFHLKEMLQFALPLLPLFAILAGFIPGCGPQIIVTTMYTAGLIPLSAQIGNAISNDGDALFPALALAPKQAIFATLLSAFPAVILAYAWFFVFDFSALLSL